MRIPVSDGREDLFATWSDVPCVTFSTHLDTVPPFVEPKLDNGVLYGRGSCDAKGIAAAMIVAAERLRANGKPASLLFVVGEETTHDGAGAANDWAARTKFNSRALINGEPTENALAVGTKGAMRFLLRTEGRAAHSAYPHLGVSATSALARLLVEMESLALPSDPLLGDTTINVGSIVGGVADNVIAPWAEARCMARLVGDADEFEATLRAWVGDRATFTRSVTVPAVRLGVVDGFETCVAAYATDIPTLTAWGTPYLLGPGTVHVAHTDEERVTVKELEDAVEKYVLLVQKLRA
jgi:acetylornithine deacetylase